MRINWEQELHELNGDVMLELELVDGKAIVKTRMVGDVEEPVTLTLGRGCISALLSEFRGDEQTNSQKFDRFNLAMQIVNNPEEPMAKGDVTLIKERVGRRYPAYTMGIIWQMLESNE